MNLPISVQTVGLLFFSNIFMTVAWYGHLKNFAGKPWWIAALVSWMILDSPVDRLLATISS